MQGRTMSFMAREGTFVQIPWKEWNARARSARNKFGKIQSAMGRRGNKTLDVGNQPRFERKICDRR